MVAENMQNIRRRIALACERCGRSPDEITLIAVTKTFSTEVIREITAAGVQDFGENYVQELLRKREELQGERIRWHFIGHLQSNKVKDIAGWIHCIQSVDSVRLGAVISEKAAKTGRRIEILVEVNTSGEKTKYGLPPEQAPTVIRELVKLTHLNVIGLMTIGPFLPDPEQSRPAFRTLRQLRETLKSGGLQLDHLSMGMSNDFEVAIEEGATMIRIGTAITGKRIRRTSI